MKLKTRLFITFLTIIILPLILSSIAFIGIGTALIRAQQDDYGMKNVDYSTMSENVQEYGKVTEVLFAELQKQVKIDASVLEKQDYLESICKKLEKKASYIIVRKDNTLYYTNNQVASNKLFDRLPLYGDETMESGTCYYYNDMQKMVKQIDFEFQDGGKGSIFLVTRINSIISRSLLLDMFIAIVLILLFTSIMLTRWINKGVFRPISDMNIAMQHIADGDLDYCLTPSCNGELAENYKNYEEMRLRLKESAEEKIQNDKKNRELISNISHDLKTPITAIKGYVEGIMDGVADTPEKIDKYIKTIYNKANDMDRLINELTIYSGIDSNRIPYHFHRLNVSEYFRDCVDDVGLDLESKNIELNYSNFISNDTVIIADPEQLKRVINNIIGNSIKYIDKIKGIIDIRILDEIDSIRVEIEDNGKGIATKDLSNVFARRRGASAGECGLAAGPICIIIGL